MKILVFVHEAPPLPLNGFGVHLSEVFDRLAGRHEVRMITYAPAGRPPLERDYITLVPRPAAAGGRPAVAARWMLSRRPARADALAEGLRGHLRAALREWQPDVVHVTPGRVASLGRDLDGTPGVLAANDAWHLNVAAKAKVASPARRRLLEVEERRVRAFVADEYPRFDRVTVVTPEDVAALRAVAPALRPVVVPNGVDPQTYAPDESVVRDASTVLFTGAMDYPPNEAAAEFLARSVMPRVWETAPAARLYLVGRNPSERVAALAADERVTVTGEVEAMSPWLNRATVYACPMVSGTGIKNKLLEALACAAPVVCTPLALQGLSAAPGRDVLVGEDERSLAAAIGRVLSDEAAARAVGEAGRRYVLDNHTWDASARGYESVFEEVIAERT